MGNPGWNNQRINVGQFLESDRRVNHCHNMTYGDLVSSKCPQYARKFCSFREEPSLAAQASTLIVVHRQLIRCPAGRPRCPGYRAGFHTGPPSQKERRVLIAKQSAARASAELVGSGTAAELAASGATVP